LERPPTPTLKGEERFRVVGKAPDGTVCVECHQAAGVFKIKDTSVADSKPAVLHPGCAPIWFGAVPS
jgi:hypothetical protein